MKHTSITLILLLVTIMIGCTKIDEVLNDDSSKGDTNNLLEEIDPSLSDTIRNMQISFFQSNLEKDSIKKAKWDSISLLGAIPIDSIKVVRIDTNNWCYILPVLNQDSLIGIIKATILEDEIKNDHLYQIKMGSQSEMSTPQFISPSDSLFYSISGYWNYNYKISYYQKNNHTRIIYGRGEYFRYIYKLGYISRVINGDIVVIGGNPSKIREGLEYFRFNGMPQIGDYSIGDGVAGIFFNYLGDEGYESLKGDAYSFGMFFGGWLESQGNLITFYPDFTPNGIPDKDADTGGGGGGGGGAIGGGDASGGSSSNSIRLNVSPKTIDLGDNYNLSVSKSTSGASITKIEFNIIDPRDNASINLKSISSSNSTFVKAYRPGNWRIQAVAHFLDGKKATSQIEDITILNPTYSKIMQDFYLMAEMEDLWNMTIKEAESEPPSYREKGAWILFDTDDNTYCLKPVSDSPEYTCEGTTSIYFEDPGIKPRYPNQGGFYVVGTVHTHPARTKCDPTKLYLVGPSEIDRGMNTVCFVFDYVGISGSIIGGHSPKDDYKLYHYGTDRSLGKQRHPLDF